jgi:hypothetical protein
VIRRETPKTQETDLHNGARLPAELIEGIGDKATMEIQELAEQMLTEDHDQELRQKLNAALENDDNQIEHIQQLIEEEAAAREEADQALHGEVAEEAEARAEADESLNQQKLDQKPDGTHPLIDETGKLGPEYIPDIIGGKVDTVDEIEPDEAKNVQLRHFVTKAWLAAAPRPLAPGRYIVIDDDHGGGSDRAYDFATDAANMPEATGGVNTFQASELAPAPDLSVPLTNKTVISSDGLISGYISAQDETGGTVTVKTTVVRQQGVTEAPNDNKTYGRKNKAWTEYEDIIDRLAAIEQRLTEMEGNNG